MPLTALCILPIAQQTVGRPFAVHVSFVDTDGGANELEVTVDQGATSTANPIVIYKNSTLAFHHPGFATVGTHTVSVMPQGETHGVVSNEFQVVARPSVPVTGVP